MNSSHHFPTTRPDYGAVLTTTVRRLACRSITTALVLVLAVVAHASTPVLTEDDTFFPTELTASFGAAMAAYGDTVVVGDPDNDTDGTDAGAAWVFVRTGSAWVEQARLTSSGASANDRFGFSVDIFEDIIVVGAPFGAGAGGTGSGVAYVFRRDGVTWSEETALVASVTVPGDPWDGHGYGDRFGYSVAINGDIPADATNNEIWHNIFVGSPGDGHSQCHDAGSVYGYQLNADGSAWVPMHKLYSDSPEYDDDFGWSVDLDGDHMIVGARRDGDDLLGGTNDPGAAYIFVRRNIDGMWNLETRITAGDPVAQAYFGSSVAVHAAGGLATFVVGAPRDDSVDYHSGSVYVFVGSASTFQQWPKVVASDGGSSHGFGLSVAVNGAAVLVGAPNFGGTNDGSAYVIGRHGLSFVETYRLRADIAAHTGRLGAGVALAGDTALAGAVDAHGSDWYSGVVLAFDEIVEPLFKDGFESGDTNAWSAVVQ